MRHFKLLHYGIILSQLCIVAFAVLYVVATFYYPGNPSLEQNSHGFDWTRNYWCDLLSPIKKDGLVNKAYPIAYVAAIVLSVGLAAFWLAIPPLMVENKRTNRLTSLLGVCSMITALFLLSGRYHDQLISISGVFGVAAILLLLYNLKLLKHKKLIYGAAICLVLCLVNNAIYYSGYLIVALPVVQKITFVFFLGWFFSVNVVGLRKTM